MNSQILILKASADIQKNLITSKESPLQISGSGSGQEGIASLSKLPYAAHTLQLSVRKGLSNEVVNAATTVLRNLCRFFRRSQTASMYLEKAQQERGEKTMMLQFDSKTRLGSTLAMIRRYLKCRESVGIAVVQLFQDQVEMGMDKPRRPTEAEIMALQTCVDVLKHVEPSTASLCVDQSSTMHLRDAAINGIVNKLSEFANTFEPGVCLACTRYRYNDGCHQALERQPETLSNIRVIRTCGVHATSSSQARRAMAALQSLRVFNERGTCLCGVAG